MTRTTSRPRMRLIASACSFALALALFGGAAHARADRLERELRFEIPAQPLATALVQFSRQAELQLVTSSVELGTRETRGVSGRLSIRRALESLLDQTGLAYSLVGENTVAISAASDSKLPGQTAGGLEGPSTQSLLSSENHLAQVEPSAESASRTRSQDKEVGQANNRQDESRPTKGESRVELGEIVVTGTHIRAAAPVGSEIIVIDRAEIDRSGFATVQDVVRTLPQNFRGGVTDFLTGSSDREGSSNTMEGNSPNLRGLGTGATLVLLNGRRMAPAGFEGLFTDVSNIPLSAVERIEVLLDGASAIYGSDAIGGVVNIILRRDYRGAETTLKVGTVTQGGSQEYQFGQLLGTNWATGEGLLSYEFYRREALPRQARALSSSCDLTPFGGTNRCNMFSNPGTLITFDPNTFEQQTWAIPAGQDGTSLTPADFTAGTVNFGNSSEGADLLSQQQRNSLSGFISQSVGERLTLRASGLFSARDTFSHGSAPIEFLTVPSNNPFFVNPTGTTDPVFIAYSFRDDFGSSTVTDTDIETYQTTLTGELKVSETWLVTTDVGYSHEEYEGFNRGQVNSAKLQEALGFDDPTTPFDPDVDGYFNPFGDGSHTDPAVLAEIGGVSSSSSGDSDLWTAGVTAEGPVWSLPGGDMRFAIGAEHRRYDFSSTAQPAGSPTVSQTSYDRELSAGFAELLIPLVGASNRRPGVHGLELSLAARYEKYNDFGDTTNPRYGVEWAPVEGLALRGSWGTSFKVPFVLDLNEDENINFIFPIEDDQGNFVDALVWLGKNRDLQEETATTWNLGIEIAPPALPGLNVMFTYFNIEFEDRIEEIFDWQPALLDPTLADIVTFNPTEAQRQEVCSRGEFTGNFSTTPGDCLSVPITAIGAIVDARIGNAAVVRNRGLDFLGSYGLQTGAGMLTFSVNATYLIELARALRPTSPLLEIANSPFNPVDLRLRGSVSWARGGLDVTTYVNYVDSYTDTFNQPNRRIDSWTTLDLAMSYKLPFQGSALLRDTIVALNVQNVFDEEPPFFDFSLGYDSTNSDLLGRFVSLQLRKSW